jgi:hypothetical protein
MFSANAFLEFAIKTKKTTKGRKQKDISDILPRFLGFGFFLFEVQKETKTKRNMLFLHCFSF